MSLSAGKQLECRNPDAGCGFPVGRPSARNFASKDFLRSAY